MRSATFDLGVISMMVAALVYLAVDGWFGETGMRNLGALKSERAAAQQALATLEAERDALLAKNARLKGPEIDRDLLDERLRATFGVARPDEVLLIGPEG